MGCSPQFSPPGGRGSVAPVAVHRPPAWRTEPSKDGDSAEVAMSCAGGTPAVAQLCAHFWPRSVRVHANSSSSPCPHNGLEDKMSNHGRKDGDNSLGLESRRAYVGISGGLLVGERVEERGERHAQALGVDERKERDRLPRVPAKRAG